MHASVEAVVVQNVTSRDQLSNTINYTFDSTPFLPPFDGALYTMNNSIGTVIKNPTISYIPVDSSDVHTNGMHVTISENITTNIRVVWPEGRYFRAQVTILTPVDMEFLWAKPNMVGSSIQQSALDPSNYSDSNFNVSLPAPFTRTRIEVSYGDLINFADNIENDNDTVVVRVLCPLESFRLILVLYV
jgi:hypothetical protein